MRYAGSSAKGRLNNNTIMKRVLVTGATGFVGSHMIDFLLEKEPECRIYATKRWRSRTDNIKHLIDNPRVEFLEFDLTDRSSIATALTKSYPDTIYHFAAQSFPGTSFNTPIQTLTTNVLGTSNLFEEIRLLKAYDSDCDFDPIVVSISSSEVYGNPNEDEVPIKETNPIRAANPYSISKVGHDLMSQYYHTAYGIRVVITRMFSHEGKRRGKEFALSSFAHQIVQHEKSPNFPNEGPYEIKVGNLNSTRTYNHIEDAVNAYYLAATKATSGEVYNIGGDETCLVGEALEMLLEQSKAPRDKWTIVVDKERLRPTDITLQIPDSTKFREETGWTLTRTLKDICEDLLDYWRNV